MKKTDKRYQVNLEGMIVEVIEESDNPQLKEKKALKLHEKQQDLQCKPLLLSFREQILIPETSKSICVSYPHL